MKQICLAIWEHTKKFFRICEHEWSPPTIHGELGRVYAVEFCRKCKKHRYGLGLAR